LTADTFCGRFRSDLPIAGSGAVAVSNPAGGDNLGGVSAIAEVYGGKNKGTGAFMVIAHSKL